MTMSHRRRSLVIRLVFGLTATALLVSVFMLYEETFLQRLALRTTKASSTTTTTNVSLTTTTRVPITLQKQKEQDEEEEEALDGESFSSSSSFLNVRPIGLNECTTVRFRSNEAAASEISYTVDEAMDILRQQNQNHQQKKNKKNSIPLRVGLVFVDNPLDFVSLSKGVFHLFHFLEFLVVAYTELHRLQQAFISADTAGGGSGGGTFNSTTVTTVTSTSASTTATLHAVQVPWLYVPLLTRQEICGAAQGINCLILNMVLTASIPTTTNSSRQQVIDIFGVESNDNVTRQVHEAFTGILSKRKQKQPPTTTGIDAADAALLRQAALYPSSSSFSQQQQHVDLVLLVDRQSCKRQQQQRIQKMWTNYIADNNNDSNNNDNDNNDNVVWKDRPSRRFPAELWHADVITALGADTLYPPPPPSVIVAPPLPKEGEDDDDENSTVSSRQPVMTVCYIDRQGTSRRLPNDFHDWLVNYLQSCHNEQILDFVHLHMENYAAIDQIRLAATCRILLGVHGNGLSHVAWMKPSGVSDVGDEGVSVGGGAVVEFFFDYPFYYDYATLSQLFTLRYFALWNGHVLDAQRIAQRNATVLQETRRGLDKNETKYYSFTQQLQANPVAIAKRLQVAQVALQDFLESTLVSLQ